MIADWAGVVWKKLPWFLRRAIVLLTQDRFTVSTAAVIMNGAGEILLLDHRIRPTSGWGLPGGFLEHGEPADQGIRREIREETGLELEELKMLRVRTVGSHIEILFQAVSAGTAVMKSPEIRDFGWFEISALPEQISSVQKALIESVLLR